MTAFYGPAIQLGGWPAIGAGVEANAVFAQAGGAASKPYIGIIGRATRTLIRTAAFLSSASAIGQFTLIRQIGNATILPSAFVPTFRLSDVVKADCIGGADNTLLTGVQHVLFGFPVAFTGQFSLSGSDFLGAPLILFPGDALVIIGGTVNVTQTLTVNIVELASP